MENKEPWTAWMTHRPCPFVRDHKIHCDYKCTHFRTYCHDWAKDKCTRQVIHGACAFGWHGQNLTKVCPTIQASRDPCIHGCTPTWRMCHERDKTKCRTSKDGLFCDDGWHLSYEEYMKQADDAVNETSKAKKVSDDAQERPEVSDDAVNETSKAKKQRIAKCSESA